MKKRFVSMVLAVLLVAACAFGAAQAGDGSKWPSYLNLGTGDDYYPIIKEGEGEDIVITMAVVQAVNGGDWPDLWVGQFYEKYMNIKFEVEQVLETALSERKNLMFAANDLPDVFLHMRFTANEIMKYGQIEGQLLNLKDYIDEELTPDIAYWFDKRPDAQAKATTPNGSMYSLPGISPLDDEGGCPRIFVDQRWLDACELENPRTLDDFIAMLRAFKAADPTGIGSDKVVPLGGAYKYMNPSWYILNALGYVGGSNSVEHGYEPALRNDEAELVVGSPMFLEYLTIMNTLYTEGLISENFFSAPTDGLEVNAQLLDNRMGVYGQPVFVTGYEDWKDWVALYPLTSEWNDTPQWMAPTGGGVGGFAMSAKAKYPEVCMRFANTYYGYDARFLWVGPQAGSEEAMGVAGINWNEETKTEDFNVDEFPEGITDIWTYLMACQGPQPGFGACDMQENMDGYRMKWLTGGTASTGKTFNLENPDQHYRASVYANEVPYIIGRFPAVYYLEEETVIRMADLAAVINPYVDEQVALFVTGRRPLSEFDAYLSELQTIGYDELNQIYKDVWANYKSAL